ncbi:MAG: T9SS type A sorting domain-containing protein [Crocinitomicaceae bacterium]|nr:T9SS type A sorting domain-containing protein [Crocinitomicaceae bacterium]
MKIKTIIINSIIPFIFSIIFIGNLFSQSTILNGGFESGTDISTANWSTHIGSGRTSDISNSGNYSMLCHNWYSYAEGQCVNGIVQTPNFQWLKDGGTPFVQKPAYIGGYYKYDTTDTFSNNDSAVVEVYFKKYNNSLQSYDTVAFGIKKLPGTDPAQGFVEFDVPITDLMSGTNPDSIVIRLSSSINGMCDSETTMDCLYFYVDDLIAGFPLGIKTPIFENNAHVWPNPVEDNLNILLNQNIKAIATVMDMNGKEILSKTIGSEHRLDLSFLKLGNYLINLKGDSLNQTHKFVKK